MALNVFKQVVFVGFFLVAVAGSQAMSDKQKAQIDLMFSEEDKLMLPIDKAYLESFLGRQVYHKSGPASYNPVTLGRKIPGTDYCGAYLSDGKGIQCLQNSFYLPRLSHDKK